MQLELTPQEVMSLAYRRQIDSNALLKLLRFYTNEVATVFDLAPTHNALKVQLDRVLEYSRGKHLIVLHISALDMTFNAFNNHYVGLLIEVDDGAAGIHKVHYIDPMGRKIYRYIKDYISSKLGERVIFSPHYDGRLQYADTKGAGCSRSFREGSNDYDCGPMLIYLLVRAVYGLSLPDVTDQEIGIRADISKRAGQKLRGLYMEDNGRTLETSNLLHIVCNQEKIVAKVKAVGRLMSSLLYQ
jgi:hypothetical protein